MEAVEPYVVTASKLIMSRFLCMWYGAVRCGSVRCGVQHSNPNSITSFGRVKANRKKYPTHCFHFTTYCCHQLFDFYLFYVNQKTRIGPPYWNNARHLHCAQHFGNVFGEGRMRIKPNFDHSTAFPFKWFAIVHFTIPERETFQLREFHFRSFLIQFKNCCSRNRFQTYYLSFSVPSCFSPNGSIQLHQQRLTKWFPKWIHVLFTRIGSTWFGCLVVESLQQKSRKHTKPVPI